VIIITPATEARVKVQAVREARGSDHLRAQASARGAAVNDDGDETSPVRAAHHHHDSGAQCAMKVVADAQQ